MLRNSIATSCVLTLLAGASTHVLADEGQRDAKPGALFERLDSNGDGAITNDEVPVDKKRMLERLLRASDANKDGKLSREEFARGLQPNRSDRPLEEKQPARARPGGEGEPDAKAIFAKLDANSDGKVTLDEVPEERRERFQHLLGRADRNGDKAVSREEFARAMARMREQGRPETNRPDAARRPVRPQMPGGLMRVLDSDHDGQLSPSEISAAPAALTKLDKNKDGTISHDELGPPPQRAAVGSDRSQPGRDFDPGQLVERAMQLDANDDGSISRDEARGPLAENFDRIDSDSNGKISRDELSAHAKTMVERLKSASPEQRRERIRQFREREGQKSVGDRPAKIRE